MTHATRITPLLLAALTLAACGGTSDSAAPPLRTTRGAITAKDAGTMTVNGVQLSTTNAAVRIDGQARPESELEKGMVVTVKGRLDDRTGEAAEIEFEHGLEGRVDDKGTDFVVVGGQVVHVDDSTEFEDGRPNRLGDVALDDTIAVSGVPDDKGGLRATRIDDSPRDDNGDPDDDDDFDLKGFVSNVQAGSFELRLSPDAADWYEVDVSGLAGLPAGFGAGAFVEVHALAPAAPDLVAPIAPLGVLTATSIELEDRFDEAEVEIEIEGIVTSGDSASFVIDGVTVETDGATRWELGAAADLVPGVKVEAEGRMDAAGVLHAEKVSFRPGVRIAARLATVAWDAVSGTGSATLLGIQVQLVSFGDYSVTPADGVKVEVRGNPSADGDGIVALRMDAFSSGGGGDRALLRAVVTAKSNAVPAAPTFTVFGYAVSPAAGATFHGLVDANGDGEGDPITAEAFYAAVEAGRTVVKVRAADAPTDVDPGARTFHADELELEGAE